MQTEVVVVGAGPVGLLLAGDLARAGVDVTVLERHPGESPLTRAFAVHARTLEQLDARGLADAVIAMGTPIERLRLLGAIEIDLSGLPSQFPFVLITPQYNVGRLLAERAEGLGVRIIRGAEVTAIEQGQGIEQGVRVTFTTDGETATVEARYAVGADGHHSTVRTALGIDFPGESVVRSLVLADVRMNEPPDDLLTVNGNRHGFCFVVPFGDGWFRVITRDPSIDLPDGAPVDLDEIRRTARAVLGTDFGMHDPRWMSRFHSEERQVPTYRSGQVFLAGDAAHVHSPAGGMGMNTGLQDAANLAWKLAAALRGSADDALLDSYQAERHPVGRLALRASGGLVRGAATGGVVTRQLRQRALRTLLAVPPVRRRALGVISGIGIRYDSPPGLAQDAGRRAEDLVNAADAVHLRRALRAGHFVLLAPPDAATALRAVGTPESIGQVEVVQADVLRWTLVRPDGYVADTGRTPDELAVATAEWGLTREKAAR